MKEKKGIQCRFNAPWPPSDMTRIIGSEGAVEKDKIEKSKKLVDEVLSYIVQIEDISTITLKEILHCCGVKEWEYYNAIDIADKRHSIIYKRQPYEVNIGPYNTVILNIFQSNMNFQFVTGIYAMLTYLI